MCHNRSLFKPNVALKSHARSMYLAQLASASSYNWINVVQAQQRFRTTLQVSVTRVVSIRRSGKTDTSSTQYGMMRRLTLTWRSLVGRSKPGRRRPETHGLPVLHDVSPARSQAQQTVVGQLMKIWIWQLRGCVAPLYLILCNSSALTSVCAHLYYQCVPASAMTSSPLTCNVQTANLQQPGHGRWTTSRTLMWTKMMMGNNHNNFCSSVRSDRTMELVTSI